MSDPKSDLKHLTNTRRLDISPERVDAMSASEAAIMLAITQCSESTKEAWSELKSVRNHLTEQDKIAIRIETKVDHTNGTVREHEADILLLKEKETARSKAEYEGVLVDRTRQAALEGVWVIPRPSWQILSFMGAAIAFLGYEKIISVIQFFIHLFNK